MKVTDAAGMRGTQNPAETLAPKCMKVQRADAPWLSVFASRAKLHQDAAK